MYKIIGIVLILTSFVLIIKAEEVSVDKSYFNMISAKKTPKLPTGEYIDEKGEKRKKSLDSGEDWRYNPSTKVWWRYTPIINNKDCVGGG